MLKTKGIASIFCAAFLTFALLGCGDSHATSSDRTSNDESSTSDSASTEDVSQDLAEQPIVGDWEITSFAVNGKLQMGGAGNFRFLDDGTVEGEISLSLGNSTVNNKTNGTWKPSSMPETFNEEDFADSGDVHWYTVDFSSNGGMEYVGYYSKKESGDIYCYLSQPTDGTTLEGMLGKNYYTLSPAPIYMDALNLNAEIEKQEVKVIGAEKRIFDDTYKGLNPDFLMADVANNSNATIKSLVVAFAAWDENGLPVQIQSKYSVRTDYVAECDMNDANILPGETWGEQGVALRGETNIAIVKAIVESYTDFDGNTWKNPLFDNWKHVYSNKPLE